MRKLVCGVLCAGVAVGFSAEANAAQVTWEVSGHVTLIEGNTTAIKAVGGSAAVGDLFTIKYLFDPNLASIATVYSPTFVDWGGAIEHTTFTIGTWQRDIGAATFATASN